MFLKFIKTYNIPFEHFVIAERKLQVIKILQVQIYLAVCNFFYCSFLYEGCQLICWIMHFELILIVKVIGSALKKNTLPLSLTAINKLSRVNILHLFTMLKLSDRFHISINWWINNEILNFFPIYRFEFYVYVFFSLKKASKSDESNDFVLYNPK